jgi:stage II sporulation protein GA (sporulation sigma-E factor processing peptidase)
MSAGGNKMSIYLDLFILENTILNLFVIYITSKLSHMKLRFFRMLMGAVLGSIFASLIVLYHPFLLQNFAVKILFSSILVWGLYFPKTVLDFIKIFCTFCFSAMLVAGTMFFLLSHLSGNMITLNGTTFITKGFDFYIGLLTILVCWIFIKILYRVKKNHEVRETLLIPLRIFVHEKNICIPALIDSGNLLCDPLTNIPVIVTQWMALKDILPKELFEWMHFKKGMETNQIKDALSNTDFVRRIRIIPFQSLGNENDLLLGFKPDKVEIGVEKKIATNVIVGIYPKCLSKNQEFQALLGTQLL